MELTLRGIGVSQGIAIGPAYPYHVRSTPIPRHAIDDPVAEMARFDEALDQARATLLELKEQTAEELGAEQAEIFQAHLDFLDDVALRPEIDRRVNEEHVNVEYLVNDLIAGYTKLLEEVEDPMFRERAMDFVDVGRRILRNLMKGEEKTLEHLDPPCIVIAKDLSPSETMNMDMPNTLGLATDSGGRTSHTSILARSFEIPSVVGLKYLSDRVSAGDTIIVDGANGDVIVRPSDETIATYREEQERLEAQRRELALAMGEGPSVTLDGEAITTMANIELFAETRLCKERNCQGVGLYRTEYLFLNRSPLPTEEEQFEAYKKVLEAMAPDPVTVRTLDLGGDKVLPGLGMDEETNPQLGWRSIRLCLDRPDIFKAQLRALFRASAYGAMRLMFPMIAGVDQLREAKQVVAEVQEDLRARGIAFDENVPLGAMIEVPAAVVVADKLAQECDFLSVGTNDLIQYTLAVDRVNERTAHLYDPTHIGVLRMLKQTIDAANKAEIPCSICGEMAGDPRLTELLLGIGYRALSMSSASLPRVRAAIANTHLPRAKRFARKVLNTGSASEIRALVEKRFERRPR